MNLEDQIAIDGVCLRFEEAYRRGEQPDLETYVEAAAPDLRNALRAELVPLLEELEAPPSDPWIGIPERIGNYPIVRRIGEGGMGTVFEALQEEPRRRVALKVVRPDLATPLMNRRFRREIGVLGHLHHPGIAQVFEAGTATVGEAEREVPFLVMEYVEGLPLLEFARQQEHSIEQRCELVISICQAVQHAHDQGVVHRDLKPANILVREPVSSASGSDQPQAGRPVVLDFGVARATGLEAVATLETQVGHIVGTLSHMSPEQLRGESQQVDARSDVYALGVVLYELLGGQLPLDLGGLTLPQAIERLSHQVPMPLGQRKPALKGDLEMIAAKALEKEAQRRYASALELAADLQRHLEGVPIQARPPSALYQFTKFARRNRALVASLFGAAVVLVASLVIVSLQAVKQTRLRRDAELERDKVAAIAQFQRDILAQANLETGGRPAETTVLELVDHAAEELADAFHDAPRIRAALSTTLGQSYLSLSQLDEAQRHFETALALYRGSEGEQHPDTHHSMMMLGRTLENQGRYAQAESTLLEAFGLAERLYPEDHPRLLSNLNNLATCYEAQGRLGEAAPLFRKLLATRERIDGPRSEPVANILNNLATLLEKQNRVEEAETLYRRALGIRREVLEPPHQRLGNSLNNLGSLLVKRGKLEDGERFLTEALAMRRQLLGPQHPELGTTLNNLAVAQQQRGDVEGALVRLRDVCDIYEAHYGPRHPSSLTMENNLIITLCVSQRHKEAYELQVDNLEAHREVYGDEHVQTLLAQSRMATCEVGTGEEEMAEARLLDALDLARLIHGETKVTGILARNLGEHLGRRGRFPEAIELLRESAELFRKLGPFEPARVYTDTELARALFASGADGAAALAKATHDLALEHLGEGHSYTQDLAQLLQQITLRK